MPQLTRRMDANWDMSFGRGLSDFCGDSESVAQNVRSRLLLLQGEWFLDTGAGVPYLANEYVDRALLEKPADLAYVESTLKATVLGTDGVDHIESFTANFDHTTRRLSVSVNVVDAYGNLSTIQVRV